MPEYLWFMPNWKRDLNKYLKTELNVCNLLIFFISWLNRIVISQKCVHLAVFWWSCVLVPSCVQMKHMILISKVCSVCKAVLYLNILYLYLLYHILFAINLPFFAIMWHHSKSFRSFQIYFEHYSYWRVWKCL